MRETMSLSPQTLSLQDAITQRPKCPPTDKLRAIKMLREVMLGERREPLPLNSAQQRNKNHNK